VAQTQAYNFYLTRGNEMEAINVGGNFRKAAKLPVKLIIGAIVLVIFAILFLTHFTP